MDWIFDNWWRIMDWFAQEPVEDGLSILAGYIVFCVALVTIISPISVICSIFRLNVRTIFLTLILLFCVILGVGAMFQVHEWLNLYQHWYLTPLGPPLEG
jgi:hypothetical protein